MANNGQVSDLSTSDYLKAAQRYPWLVALPILLLGFLAWFLLGRGSAEYFAEADVLVRATQAQQEFDQGGGRYDPNFLDNEVRFARSDVVRDSVADRLGIESFAELRDINVEITASETSEVLTFAATDPSADGAATKANSYAEAYVVERRQSAVDSYSSAIDLLDEQLGDIRNNRTRARVDIDAALSDLAGLDEESPRYAGVQASIDRMTVQLAAQLEAFDTEESALIAQQSSLRLSQNLAKTGIASVTNSAFAPVEPLPNAGIRGFIIAELIGLVLGLLLAVTLYKLDDRMRDVSDVESAFPDLSILGTLPYQASVRKRRSLTVLSDPGSAYSEAIYQIRTSLRFMMLEKGVRLVVVTSSQPAEGKTTFSANFAWSLAGPDEKVVLIDGDLRRPVGHEHFGVELAPGLTDMVLYNRQLASVGCRFNEQDADFSFIPAGMYSGNPADFMGSSQMIKQVRSISDDALTVVDAAPVLPVSDARAIAGASDLTILVVRLEEAHRKDVAAAVSNLKNAGASNIALVLVGGRVKARGYYGTSGEARGGASGSGQPTVVAASRVSRPTSADGRRATVSRQANELAATSQESPARGKPPRPDGVVASSSAMPAPREADKVDPPSMASANAKKVAKTGSGVSKQSHGSRPMPAKKGSPKASRQAQNKRGSRK